MAGRIFVAKTSFSFPDGWITEGDTVREGHPVMQGREHLFEERRDEALFEYEAPKPAQKPSAGSSK